MALVLVGPSRCRGIAALFMIMFGLITFFSVGLTFIHQASSLDEEGIVDDSIYPPAMIPGAAANPAYAVQAPAPAPAGEGFHNIQVQNRKRSTPSFSIMWIATLSFSMSTACTYVLKEG